MMRVVVFFSSLFKGVLFLIKPHYVFGFLSNPFLFVSNTLAMSKWKSSLNSKSNFDDFYTYKRDYIKRYKLYEYILASQQVNTESIAYLEFGVASGISFKWWLENHAHADSRFYGFDTFEGLPEDWGGFSKGDMSYNIPNFNDSRALFIKGLFQDTLLPFITSQKSVLSKRIILHMDADLFSSTLYTLMVLYPYLKKGDIIMFDEFNVPNHEFYAFKLFQEISYKKLSFIGGVNNYYQAAFIVD